MEGQSWYHGRRWWRPDEAQGALIPPFLQVSALTIIVQVEVLTLELKSPTLPGGRPIIVDLNNPQQLANMKENPIQVKEGAEYRYVPAILHYSCSGSSSRSCHITFKVNHSLVTVWRIILYVGCAETETKATITGLALYPSCEARLGERCVKAARVPGRHHQITSHSYRSNRQSGRYAWLIWISGRAAHRRCRTR